MNYKGLYITCCADSGIERTDKNGKAVLCDGFFYQVFTDEVTVMNGDEPNENMIEMLELPAADGRLKEVEEKLGILLTESVWVDIHSEIDGIDDCTIGSMDNIYELNGLANTVADLPRQEFAKFKAILDHE